MASFSLQEGALSTDQVVKCGAPECVCERERLDVHTQEPQLPTGYQYMYACIQDMRARTLTRTCIHSLWDTLFANDLYIRDLHLVLVQVLSCRQTIAVTERNKVAAAVAGAKRIGCRLCCRVRY